MIGDDDGPEPWPESFTAGLEWLDLLTALEKETERGRALMQAHFLDDFLGRALRNYMVGGEGARKLMAGFNAPFGTFSAKIAGAAALGLIDDREFKLLDAFRECRNVYAHSIAADFTGKKVKKALATLAQAFNLEPGSAPDFVIEYAGRMLVTELINRPAWAEQKRLRVELWPQHRPD